MREKIKQLIAEQIIEQSKLKLMIRNLSVINELSDAQLSELLDEIAKIETIIQKLRQFLKES